VGFGIYLGFPDLLIKQFIGIGTLKLRRVAEYLLAILWITGASDHPGSYRSVRASYREGLLIQNQVSVRRNRQ
jgi:hypothetical protein